nr:hypothetical protein Iba_chr08eCG7850 [Ipomoea batatas]
MRTERGGEGRKGGSGKSRRFGKMVVILKLEEIHGGFLRTVRASWSRRLFCSSLDKVGRIWAFSFWIQKFIWFGHNKVLSNGPGEVYQ